MSTWIKWMSMVVMTACIAANLYAEESDEARSASGLDRTPVIAVTEPQVDETQTEATQPVKDASKMTVEERLDELEHLVRSLIRQVDPYNMRDEMRLERRIRDLERQLERVEQELRRLQADRRF